MFSQFVYLKNRPSSKPAQRIGGNSYFVLASLLCVQLTGCASTSGKHSFAASRVIERAGGVDETPSWTDGALPLYEEGGQVIFVNTMSMSGDSRPEACSNVAADLGRAQILRHVKDNLTISGQLAEATASSDPSIESLFAFLSQGSLSGVKTVGRYWERREESDVNGQRVLRLHCTAKIAIAKSHLDRQLRQAMDGASSGNPEIRQKLIEAQKDFIDSLSQKNSPIE